MLAGDLKITRYDKHFHGCLAHRACSVVQFARISVENQLVGTFGNGTVLTETDMHIGFGAFDDLHVDQFQYDSQPVIGDFFG